MYINSAPFSPSSQQTESAFYHQLVVQNPFKKFIYLWLRWVFVAEQAFSSCGKWGLLSICSVWASDCGGFSYGAQALGHVGSAIVAHGLICSTAHGIFPDQGSNPCPLHWQVDSYPLYHQGSLSKPIFNLVHACPVTSVVSDSATLWIVAHQAPLSMEFSRQEHWNGLPFPIPEDLPPLRDWTCISCISCIGRQIFLLLHHLGSLWSRMLKKWGATVTNTENVGDFGVV